MKSVEEEEIMFKLRQKEWREEQKKPNKKWKKEKKKRQQMRMKTVVRNQTKELKEED